MELLKSDKFDAPINRLADAVFTVRVRVRVR